MRLFIMNSIDSDIVKIYFHSIETRIFSIISSYFK